MMSGKYITLARGLRVCNNYTKGEGAKSATKHDSC